LASFGRWQRGLRI